MIMNQEQFPTYKTLSPVQGTPTTSIYILPSLRQLLEQETGR
jgi:hypothetical protein